MSGSWPDLSAKLRWYAYAMRLDTIEGLNNFDRFYSQLPSPCPLPSRSQFDEKESEVYAILNGRIESRIAATFAKEWRKDLEILCLSNSIMAGQNGTLRYSQ